MLRHARALPQIDTVAGSTSDPAPVREGRSDPAEVVHWALRRFADRRLVTTTGFGMEGCVLVDMLDRAGYRGAIIYLDTHFLFPETHALRDRLAARYPKLTFVNAGTDVTPAAQAARLGPRLWETDPDRCCDLRKVQPMRRVMQGRDVWVTAIRREQSAARAHTRFVEWDHRYDLLKIAPLAYWSRRQVYDYIKANRVPYNELHERGYPSIGCTHCTRSVPGARPDDYSRSGRWSGTEKTECGLHQPSQQDGSGI